MHAPLLLLIYLPFQVKKEHILLGVVSIKRQCTQSILHINDEHIDTPDRIHKHRMHLRRHVPYIMLVALRYALLAI